MPNNSGGACSPMTISDGPTPIAALRNELRVSKALHQHDPGACDVSGVPASRGRLAREAVAGDRRDHQMESVRCACAICCGISERIDDLQLFDDRTGPSVRDDHGQRVFMVRANVNEMDVEPVDLGDELRKSVKFYLAFAPIVFFAPIAREL